MMINTTRRNLLKSTGAIGLGLALPLPFVQRGMKG